MKLITYPKIHSQAVSKQLLRIRRYAVLQNSGNTMSSNAHVNMCKDLLRYEAHEAFVSHLQPTRIAILWPANFFKTYFTGSRPVNVIVSHFMATCHFLSSRILPGPVSTERRHRHSFVFIWEEKWNLFLEGGCDCDQNLPSDFDTPGSRRAVTHTHSHFRAIRFHKLSAPWKGPTCHVFLRCFRCSVLLLSPPHSPRHSFFSHVALVKRFLKTDSSRREKCGGFK